MLTVKATVEKATSPALQRERGAENLFMHILSMTRIYDNYRVTIYYIGIIPTATVGHVFTFPATNGWGAT